jgi:hypothetical protein
MSVYVDNMNAKYHGMTMCHMIADSTDELVAMAERIGVARKWIQAEGTWREHFDVCLSKRAMAVRFGAMEISMWELARKLGMRRTMAQIKAAD